MTRSLCEKCALMREIITPKGSRFLLCQLSKTNRAYQKYPPQPVIRCDGYEKNKLTGEQLSNETAKRKDRPVSLHQDGRIEIQGDQRDRIVAELEKLGYKVSRVGA
jgi:hypothetical protein